MAPFRFVQGPTENGVPRCGSCGHTMYRSGRGFLCIENTCVVGLIALGDFTAAQRMHIEDQANKALVTYCSQHDIFNCPYTHAAVEVR